MLQSYCSSLEYFIKVGLGPDWMKRGEAKQCFANASNWVFDCPTLLYGEGLALEKSSGGEFVHGSCVQDGRVLEPTLAEAEGYEYFGIVVNQGTLIEWTERQRTYGLLDGYCTAEFINWFRACRS